MYAIVFPPASASSVGQVDDGIARTQAGGIAQLVEVIGLRPIGGLLCFEQAPPSSHGHAQHYLDKLNACQILHAKNGH
jgi:hypothetical protein